ncbi:P-II family nitrogen regulator [Suilimivivens sp.]|uniref:P-II family nitrogen regulator n=1 Tax=Suilimivivens sp. TaxID=2981669 RepID=UPI00307AE829
MSKLNLMTTIVDRNQVRKYLHLYEEEGLQIMLVTLGDGTASGDVLDYLGLEATEKAVIFSALTDENFYKTKKSLQKKLQIDAPGGGIAFIVPFSSIGGKKALQFFTVGQDFQKEEESALKDTTYELVIVIANQGYIEMVMDAARGAGAYGGTVIHAKGTGMEQAEKFMGVSLAAEKEMIFIVAKKEQKNDIMKAVMEQAGLDTKAKSIVFSLPVTDTAGLRLLED